MNLSTEPSVLWERNKARKWDDHSQLSNSQTVPKKTCRQRKVGFYWTLLGVHNNGMAGAWGCWSRLVTKEKERGKSSEKSRSWNK